METKEFGLIVKTLDYDDNDQIVTMITETEVLSFIALGVRKLTSKNRVAIQMGNIVEVELFKARLKNKLSKLKRANVIKQLPIQSLDTAMVWVNLLKILSRLKDTSPRFLRAVIESYSKWGTEYNQHIRNYILFFVLDIKGVLPTNSKCVDCQRIDSINGFDFFKGGFTCKLHTKNKRDLPFLKGIHALFEGFNSYLKTSPFTNKEIYLELVNFLKHT